MAVIKTHAPYNSANFGTADQAVVLNEGGRQFARFTTGIGDPRSESRSIVGSTRWWTLNVPRATHWQSRLHADSEGRFGVIFQMKWEEDDVLRLTPTRAIDMDKGAYGGRLVWIVRNSYGGTISREIMSADQLRDAQDRVIDFVHSEKAGKDSTAYSKLYWKFAEDNAWRNIVDVRGPNVRPNAQGGGTYTWGFYRGDTADVDWHDLFMDKPPVTFTTEEEAFARAGIGAVPPPPPPPDDCPTKLAALQADYDRLLLANQSMSTQLTNYKAVVTATVGELQALLNG